MLRGLVLGFLVSPIGERCGSFWYNRVMDRTAPSSSNQEIALYIRTYYSLLRSSAEVQLHSLVEAHKQSNSALHVGANDLQPDMAAFIYAVLRLPDCLFDGLRLVVMGQSASVFNEMGYPDIESWQLVSAPARRRRCFFDGKETLAVFIASLSDIDDLIPTLTACEIEWNKLHVALSRPGTASILAQFTEHPLTLEALESLSAATGLFLDDLDRLVRIWGDKTATYLQIIASRRLALSVRLLRGSLADYRRATQRWWNNIARHAPLISFADRPVYFVSSNTHSLANIICGFGLYNKANIINYIRQEGSPDLQQEYEDILQSHVPSSWENFLYYALKKVESRYPKVLQERLAYEMASGIIRVPSEHVFDVETQIIELNRLRPGQLDPRVCLPGIENLANSNALILNIDFPLGMAAYQILSEMAHNIASIRGIYIMGKAAILNGRIGDVMIPSVVHDEHSLNTYLFNNCFTAGDISPYLTYGSVLDNQKAITVRGTFLQNREYMAVFYHEGYTDMEMEAGPFLSSVYELSRPQRHPTNEIVNLYNAPFPIGILHYASDTPFSKGKNLGSKNLSYFGMDATYATTIAILGDILKEEIRLNS